MELRHLRYFVAVAETLHFSRAAARLHLTQPALSRQLRDLESEIGAPLLARHRVATALTPAGVALLPRAREILAAAEHAIEAARHAGQRLRLGHYGTLWLDFFAPALRAFCRKHPGVELHAEERTAAGLIDGLRCGELDFALIGPSTPALDREFATRPLAELPLLIALGAANPLAKRRRLALADLASAEWIAWDEAAFPGRAGLLEAAAARIGFRPKVVGSVDGVASLFLRVSTSDAIGYVLPMSKKLPHAGVVFASLRPPGLALTMHAAWRRHAGDAARLAALAEALVAPSGARAGH
ncbi:MAG TPA: LysR substrate-binding domain-containing protein [Opitutaceae bacterium]|nr:LysR substrate-binding domain-containing protein [Opitutaceae bacterium]